MRAGERERQALRVLAAIPFLDRLELAAVAGMYEEASHNALDRLRREGLADFISHAAPLTATTRRWRLTGDGLRRLALEDGMGVERLLRTHPVSGLAARPAGAAGRRGRNLPAGLGGGGR